MRGVPVTASTDQRRSGAAGPAQLVDGHHRRGYGHAGVSSSAAGSQTVISLGRAAAPAAARRDGDLPGGAAGPGPGRARARRRGPPAASGRRRPTGRTGRARCRAAGPGRPAGWRPRRRPRPGTAVTTMSTPSISAATTVGPLGPGIRHQGQPVQRDAQPRRRRPRRASAGRPRRTTSRPGRPRRAGPAQRGATAAPGLAGGDRDGAAPAQAPAGQQPAQLGQHRQHPLRRRPGRARSPGAPDRPVRRNRPPCGPPSDQLPRRCCGSDQDRHAVPPSAPALPAGRSVARRVRRRGRPGPAGRRGRARPPPPRRTARPRGAGRRPPGR